MRDSQFLQPLNFHLEPVDIACSGLCFLLAKFPSFYGPKLTLYLDQLLEGRSLNPRSYPQLAVCSGLSVLSLLSRVLNR